MYSCFHENDGNNKSQLFQQMKEDWLQRKAQEHHPSHLWINKGERVNNNEKDRIKLSFSDEWCVTSNLLKILMQKKRGKVD